MTNAMAAHRIAEALRAIMVALPDLSRASKDALPGFFIRVDLGPVIKQLEATACDTAPH